MNRRKFMQGVFAGIATVAIASKLAPAFPKAMRVSAHPMGLDYIITAEEVEDGLYGDIGHRYANALAKSMMETREVVAADVFNRAFG